MKHWTDDPTWRRLVLAQTERLVVAKRRGPECYAAALDGLVTLIHDAESAMRQVPPIRTVSLVH